MHPEVLFAYSNNYVELILRVENRGKGAVWTESDIKVPDKVSLSPSSELRKGRVRIGIVDKKEYLEKSIRIYANGYTNPQVYRGSATLYIFDKDGVILSRMEKPFDVRVEMKKEASF